MGQRSGRRRVARAGQSGSNGALARLLELKYLRTVVTQLIYWPLLFRELKRADVVHVFSASYTSFLLAPLPAILVGACARPSGHPELPQRRSTRPPEALGDRARRHRARRSSIVPSRFLVDVFSSFGFDAVAVPNVVDLDRFRFRDRFPLRPRLLSTRNFESLYNVACTLRAFKLVQNSWPDASLTLVGGGRWSSSSVRSLRELRARTRRRSLDACHRTRSPSTTPTTTSTSRARTSTTCRRRFSRPTRAGCRSCRRKRAEFRRF